MFVEVQGKYGLLSNLTLNHISV